MRKEESIKIRVLILTEGGKNIGFGHITRCTSIHQAFENFSIKPQFIVNGDETVRDFVKDKNGLGHPLRDCKIFDWLNNRETLFAVLRDADIVFVDSYLAGYDLYEKISSIAKTGVYFDDDIRIKYPKGFVVNSVIFAERMSYPKRNGVTYLLGTQYTPVRKEFWDVPAKPIRDNVEIIMITFGGADMRNLTPRVLKLLVDTYPGLVKKVIVGKSFRNTAEIEALKNHNTELIYYPDAAEMEKLMLESDIAVSAGGQTLYELARMGLATIGICVAQNQLQNVEGWTKSGFLEYIGWYNDKDILSKFTYAIDTMRPCAERLKRYRIGRHAVDGKGMDRLCKVILAATSGESK